MSDLRRGRRRFSPGVVDYNASISAHYQTARALAAETAEIWCALLQPFLTPFGVPTIVDLGCGTGRFSALLAERFQARVVGVEPALAMLNIAVRNPGRGVLAYVAGRAESLPLRDRSGDIAWLSHVVHHIADRAACARELRRVIRPQGRVLIRGTFGDRLDGFPTLFHFFPGAREVAAEFPSLAVVISDFVAAGFAVEHLQTVPRRSATASGSLLIGRAFVPIRPWPCLLTPSSSAASLPSRTRRRRKGRPLLSSKPSIYLSSAVPDEMTWGSWSSVSVHSLGALEVEWASG